MIGSLVGQFDADGLEGGVRRAGQADPAKARPANRIGINATATATLATVVQRAADW